MVHELARTTPPEQTRCANLLKQLGPDDAAQIIRDVEVDGERIIITKFLLGFTSFRDWLEAAVARQSTFVIDTRGNPPTMDLSVHDAGRHYSTPAESLALPALDDTAIGRSRPLSS